MAAPEGHHSWLCIAMGPMGAPPAGAVGTETATLPTLPHAPALQPSLPLTTPHTHPARPPIPSPPPNPHSPCHFAPTRLSCPPHPNQSPVPPPSFYQQERQRGKRPCVGTFLGALYVFMKRPSGIARKFVTIVIARRGALLPWPHLLTWVDTEVHYNRSDHRNCCIDIHEGPRAFEHLSFPIRQMAVCQFRLSCTRAVCGSETPVLVWSYPGVGWHLFMIFWERFADVLTSMLQPSSDITSNGVALCRFCKHHFASF